MAFKVELRDFYPRMYAFLIHNHIVHMGTGKYHVADFGDVKAIEEASTVTIWATPKRRTTIPRTPSEPDPDFKLNKDQKELYERAPAVVMQLDADLGAIISQCMTTNAARNALFRACGTSGRAMAMHL